MGSESQSDQSPFDDKYRFNDSQTSVAKGIDELTTVTKGTPSSSVFRDQQNVSSSGSQTGNEESTDDVANVGISLKTAHVGFQPKEDAPALPRRKTIFRRDRWGTQRHKNGRPVRKTSRVVRRNTLKRAMNHIPQGKRLFSGSVAEEEENQHRDEKDRSNEKRNVYWNMPVPEDQLDDDGRLPEYPRNKIRTTKYTPITFIPKNLFYQFKNVANIFFLTMIVLGFFSIFGVPNPALNAVPLIVIVIITAFKDALEDSRRTISDMEINNTVTHVLKGLDNPNFSGESVSLWRRFKKMCTRVSIATYRKIRRRKVVDPLAYPEANMPRRSMDSFDRTSFEMELPNDSGLSLADPFNDANMVHSQAYDPIDNYTNKPKPFLVPRKPGEPSANLAFKRDYWKNVHVGDIIKIKNNDQIPVDIVILNTSDPDGGCYVETKNLDGETNLKIKQALKCSSNYLKRVNDLDRCKFWLESEGPKGNLYSYEGNVRYYVNGDPEGETSNEPVTINNLLLRGSSLRNTKWTIGLVAFTGPDTKIMLNAGVTPSKRSRISRELNYQVVINFVLLFFMCFVSGLVNGLYYRKSGTSRDSYEFGTIGGSPARNGVISFFVALILYQSLVPISLYISIEIIKTAQAFFIYSDVKMYNEKLDYPCIPKSWSISDDLGQIEYIFSDKTGTLTQNVMEFKKCTIDGKVYGRAYTEAYADIRRRQGVDVEAEAAFEKAGIAQDKQDMIKMLQQQNKKDLDETKVGTDLTFVSKSFAEDLHGNSGGNQKVSAENFALALALCHSVLTEQSDTPPYEMEFRAQSPDEAALVSTARDIGFAFVNRTKTGIVLDVQGVEREYEILNILEFNSTRKRMSVIIKVPAQTPGAEPTALLICKGADSVVFSRLSNSNSSQLLEKTAIQLEQFATEGLRTLCIAQREISWSDYEAWNVRHNAAASSLDDREEKMEEAASEIEQDLILLGGTAIEDRLQDGVPESIKLLGKAGIKLWVLTGDKVETAINIGFSCNLLQNDMQLLIIKATGDDIQKLLGDETWDRVGNSKRETVNALVGKYLFDNFGMRGTNEEMVREKGIHKPPSGNFGIVIDGDALKMALSDSVKIKFLLLCKQCKAVLCCRVSPAQKAAVVKLVKDSLQVMTLAIGDGSNDVAMIHAADVGVGIAGEEGTQAAMSSDYAIAQFRYLTRLVLVHGRWDYKRLAEMIPSFFYKNVVFTTTLFWYGIFDNFDGTYLFEYTYLMFYNLAYTSLPVIFMGIFDKDVEGHISLLVPELYRSGILRKDWNVRKFVWYMADGVYQSLVAFFLPFFLYRGGVFVTHQGLALDHRYLVGTLVATISIFACDTYVLLHQHSWDWLTLLIDLISMALVPAWTGIWSSVYTSKAFYKAAIELYSSASFWACFFVGYFGCLMPRVCYDITHTLRNPKDADIVREQVSLGYFEGYSKDYDPTDPNRVAVKAGEPGLDAEGGYAKKRKFSLFRRHGSSGSDSSKDVELQYMHSSRKNRTSVDATRLSMDYSVSGEGNGRGTSLDNVRTSLDLPGMTTANSLMERISTDSRR